MSSLLLQRPSTEQTEGGCCPVQMLVGEKRLHLETWPLQKLFDLNRRLHYLSLISCDLPVFVATVAATESGVVLGGGAENWK